MDGLTLGVIIGAVVLVVVGMIFAYHGNKVNEQMQQEELKKKQAK